MEAADVMADIADLIADTREYIEKHGWWRGALFGPNGSQVCIFGAMYRALGKDRIDGLTPVMSDAAIFIVDQINTNGLSKPVIGIYGGQVGQRASSGRHCRRVERLLRQEQAGCPGHPGEVREDRPRRLRPRRMSISAACARCGCDRFKAGEIQPAPEPEGGFYVVMPCSDCGYPNALLHDHDPEFAQALLEFFAAGPPAPERKT